MSEEFQLRVKCCEHCWHLRNWQHTIAVPRGWVHKDEVCCHCGQEKCETVPIEGYDSELSGHGPHHPDRGFRPTQSQRGIIIYGNDEGTGTIRVRSEDDEQKDAGRS